MKMLPKIGIAILTFLVGIIAATAWFGFRLPIPSLNPVNANASEIEKSDNLSEEKRKHENEEAQCLNAEIPNLKRIVHFGVLNIKAIEIPKPEYPAEAKAAKISGEVKVGAVIDETGKVVWARVESGHPLLQAAVKRVVCQARFKPVTISGKPITVNGIITYKFVLE